MVERYVDRAPRVDPKGFIPDYDGLRQALGRDHKYRDPVPRDIVHGSGYDPKLGGYILGFVNTLLDRTLSKPRMRSAPQTEKAFSKFFAEIITDYPDLVYDTSDFIKHLIPAQKIKEAVLTEGIDSRFYETFTHLKTVISPDEMRQPLGESLQTVSETESEAILDMFQDPDAVSLFTSDEVRGFLRNAGKKTHDFTLLWDSNYFSSGLLISEDLEEICIDRIGRLQNIEGIKQHTRFFSGEEGLDRVKGALRTAYLQQAKLGDLGKIVDLKEWLTPEEREQIVKTAMYRQGKIEILNGFVMSELLGTQGYIALMKEAMFESTISIDAGEASDVFRILLQEGRTTHEEIRADANRLIAIGRGGMLVDWLYRLKQIYRSEPDEEWNAMKRKILQQSDPVEFAGIYRQKAGDFIDNIIPQDEIITYLANVSGKGVDEWIKTFANAEFLLEGFGVAFLQENIATHTAIMWENFAELQRLIPRSERQDFVNRLVEANPLAALLTLSSNPAIFKKARVKMTGDTIKQYALSDKNAQLSFAPETLKNTYRRFSFQKGRRSAKKTPEQQAYIIEATTIHETMQEIQATGTESDFKRVLNAQKLSGKQEQELLAIFYCFNKMQQKDPNRFSNLTQGLNSFEDARQVLFHQLTLVLKRQEGITDSQIANFFATMDSPGPFTEYLLQYENHPRHIKLLTEIFDAVLAGEFPEWKYGPHSVEAFEQLKEQKMQLLPKELTYEQYLLWQADGKTTLVESLVTDLQTTTERIKDYLSDNEEHLELVEGVTFKNIGEKLTLFGQEIVNVSQQLISASRNRLSADKISSLQERRRILNEQRKKMLRSQMILHLQNLKPYEVAVGSFFEGEQRQQHLNAILKKLKASSLQSNEFIYDHVAELLAELRNKVPEQQNLVCTDSSDPKVWIEIGERPVASCQSYRNGSLNESLPGYTDPNTKILFLTGEQGSPIGRAIFRLLEQEDGTPNLHIERIYSASGSPAVDRIIIAHAFRKAEEMGMSLTTSKRSQDEYGKARIFKAPKGYKTRWFGKSLFSRAARAPQVYVDGGRVGPTSGKYQMKELLVIELE